MTSALRKPRLLPSVTRAWKSSVPFRRESTWWDRSESEEVRYVPYVDRRTPLRRLGEEWPKGKPVHPDYYLFRAGIDAGSEVGFACGLTFMLIVGGVWIGAAVASS